MPLATEGDATARRPRLRWKLWHASALVAVAALAMAAEVRRPGICLHALFFAPPAVAAWIWIRSVFATEEGGQPLWGPTKTLLKRTIWLLFFLILYYLLLVLCLHFLFSSFLDD